MRRSKPVPINDLLKLFVKEFGLENNLKEQQFLRLWDETMGITVSKATTNRVLKNRKLYIYLSSSVIRQELFMMRTEIVKELNKRMGEYTIDELVLK